MLITYFSKDIVNEPEEITGLKGNTIPRRISVRYISFSAHVDYSQNSEFIDLVGAQHIVCDICRQTVLNTNSPQVLVHGEQTAMSRLRGALTAKYREREEDVKIHTPRNLETLELSFRGDRVAKVSSTEYFAVFRLTFGSLQAIGTLAANPPVHNSHLSGLLVAKDFSYTLLDPKDLRDFTGLSTSSVVQKVKIAITCGWELVKWHLEGMYGAVEEGRDKGGVILARVSTTQYAIFS